MQEIQLTLPYLTAAIRAVLPIPISVCSISVCPNNHTGWFSEAGLLEWMRFVIFQQRSRERSQRTSRPISE